MCRLYSFRSNVRRKVECELIRAQNSLITQSLQDERGSSNPHGWGLGTYSNGASNIVRQLDPAYDSEEFRWTAAQVYTCNVMAHVRRATIGKLSLENTHPFEHGRWMLIHNGNINAFQAIRPMMLDAMSPSIRESVQGDTDSEHVFKYIMSLHEQRTEEPILDILRQGIKQVINWSEEAEPGSEAALNIIMSNGEETLGSSLGRSLWYVKRKAVHPCEVCGGALHVEEDPGADYRAVVIASEPITNDEEWTAVPEGSLFHIDSNISLKIDAL